MIHQICKDIIKQLNINKFIETGTHLGGTVAEVSSWFQNLDPDFGTIKTSIAGPQLNKFVSPEQNICRYPVFENSSDKAKTKLYSIDIDKQRQNILQTLFQSNPNIKLISDYSDKFIKKMIDTNLISDEDNCFFYLDAHGGESWPLRDEISEILKLKRSIISIDDFVVPFQPNAGFDVYGNKICDWYYIKDLFENHKTYLYYPNKPDTDNRGKVFIFVGYNKNELKFMEKLPCFKPLFKGDLYITTLKVRLIHTKLYSSIEKTKLYSLIRKNIFKKIGIS